MILNFRPVDEKTCSTPMEPTIPDAIRTDGGIQKFARTVTGMFNTFKGALPGNIEPVQAKNDQWIFVENEATVRCYLYYEINFCYVIQCDLELISDN